MNLSEFKAWFEGFTENLDGRPTEKQWERIQAKIEKIKADPTPWPVFIDRYVRPYWHEYPWGRMIASSTGSLSSASAAGSMTQGITSYQTEMAALQASAVGSTDSAAMLWQAAGRAEARSMRTE